MKLITRLNQHFGTVIRDQVILDIAQGTSIRPPDRHKAIQIFAMFILSTPYIVIAAGCAICYFGFYSIPLIVVGLIIIAAGIYLRPAKYKNTFKTLDSSDLPSLFALLGDISKQLNAPKINGIHLDGDFNAYATQFSKSERILGIGAPLWRSLEASERLALLAHETAHFTNNDPARGKLPAAALNTLSSWIDIFEPPELLNHEAREIFVVDDRDLLGRILGGTFGNFFKAIAYAFEQLVFADSQRAEYLADIHAANISGKTAKQSMLKKLIIIPLADQALAKTYYDGRKHMPLFEIMSQAIRKPDPELSQKLYAEAAETLHTIDSSHPPTRYRLEVVGAAGAETPALDINDYDWQKIDAELSNHFHQIEAEALSSMIVQ